VELLFPSLGVTAQFEAFHSSGIILYLYIALNSAGNIADTALFLAEIL
jgi:hypothetical protein